MKSSRKRITTLLLCLCFLLELGPVSAFAAEEENSSGVETVRVLDCHFTPASGEGCACSAAEQGFLIGSVRGAPQRA